MSVDLVGCLIPALYRDLYEMINLHGLEKITFPVFAPVFESNTLNKNVLNQIWYTVVKTNSINSRNDFYKCLALMALAQQGKTVDEKLLNNYVNRELPTPTLDSINSLEDRLIRLIRNDQRNTTLCFRYNDLCALDTIQVSVVPEKKGVIIRHVEYEINSMRQNNKVLRRYNDFVALHELLSLKYPHRIIPVLPPKKTVNVDKEFIEERRRSLKRYLQILCRHPTVCETDIIKFFLTFQGTSCGDNMKATYKNVQDEFSSEPRSLYNTNDNTEKCGEDTNGIQMFRISHTHMSFILQQLTQIRECLKGINEKQIKNANEFSTMEKTLQTLSTDSTKVDRWATGANDYWPLIQLGLAQLPVEMGAVSERLQEQYRRDEDIINDHLDLLIDILYGYKELCKRFEEALTTEQKAAGKQRRSVSTTDASSKNELNLDMIQKRNRHALKCIQMETQLVYANLEAFVYILSSLGNSQCKGCSDLLNIWKSFASKISQLGQNYVNASATQRTNTMCLRR
ncbi:unnamed protein product [Adineta ricciae]|uniref:Sorting nexin-8 n=1 Tax=Adineta ricciae TaxID=249248 RepID=A0A814EBP1_ADIRI|nr:unnamed protein product [Adineta ricciae]